MDCDGSGSLDEHDLVLLKALESGERQPDAVAVVAVEAGGAAGGTEGATARESGQAMRVGAGHAAPRHLLPLHLPFQVAGGTSRHVDSEGLVQMREPSLPAGPAFQQKQEAAEAAQAAEAAAAEAAGAAEAAEAAEAEEPPEAAEAGRSGTRRRNAAEPAEAAHAAEVAQEAQAEAEERQRDAPTSAHALAPTLLRVLAFFALGWLAYGEGLGTEWRQGVHDDPPGWSKTDCLYFAVVTSTTVRAAWVPGSGSAPALHPANPTPSPT
jgi:hypothetical protein